MNKLTFFFKRIDTLIRAGPPGHIRYAYFWDTLKKKSQFMRKLRAAFLLVRSQAHTTVHPKSQRACPAVPALVPRLVTRVVLFLSTGYIRLIVLKQHRLLDLLTRQWAHTLRDR